MLKRLNSTLTDGILIGIIAGLVYSPILKGFFAQDEWYAFGNYISNGAQVIREGLIPGPIHYIPLTHIFNYLAFSLFGLSYQSYALVSIFLHSLASILVYLFLKELTQSRKLALAAGLLFSIRGMGEGYDI